MTLILELIKILLPSLVVVLAVDRVMRWNWRKQESQQANKLKLETEKQLLPIRLQAAERMVLFLERISPEALLHRIAEPGMSAKALHLALLTSIRAEYEHNFSQQLYIDEHVWAAIRSAKEEVVALANSAGQQCGEQSTSLDFSRALLEIIQKQSNYPTAAALALLRKSIQNL